MSAKVTKPTTIMSVTGVSATQTSSAFNVRQMDNVAIQCTWSNGASTPTGTFDVEATVDGTNWVQLNASTQLTYNVSSAQANNSGSMLIVVPVCAFDQIRCKWNRTAGTLDIVMKAMAKASANQ